jgi:hypothetical protein
MILNDMKLTINGKFVKEITIDDDGEDIIYVFPDTSQFISIMKRKLTREFTSEMEE